MQQISPFFIQPNIPNARGPPFLPLLCCLLMIIMTGSSRLAHTLFTVAKKPLLTPADWSLSRPESTLPSLALLLGRASLMLWLLL